MAKRKTKAEEQAQELLLDGDDLSFLDWAAPEDQLDPELHPYVQWNNEAAAWEFPIEHWGGSRIESDNEVVEVVHNFGQDSEPGIILPMVHVAVIAYRMTWEGEGLDGKRFYSAQYQEGMRKRYNFMVLIKEQDSPDPAIITARSYTGVYILNALKAHRKAMAELVKRIRPGQRYPSYMFWLPLAAGEKVYVGSSDRKAQIQPPVPAYPAEGDITLDAAKALLTSLYIGDDLRQTIADYLYPQGEAWREEFISQAAAALPSGGPAVAEILPGGVLYLPDLSAGKPGQWAEMAMSIDGLFDHIDHARNSFSKMLRDRGLTRAPLPDMWEAWREYLEEKVAAKHEAEQELMLTAG